MFGNKVTHTSNTVFHTRACHNYKCKVKSCDETTHIWLSFNFFKLSTYYCTYSTKCRIKSKCSGDIIWILWLKSLKYLNFAYFYRNHMENYDNI